MLDVNKIREDFPVLSKKVYDGQQLVWLDSAATSQKPRSVIQSIVDYYEGYNANVHRGVHALSVESTAAFEDARQKVGNLINAESSECIIWTRNATESTPFSARKPIRPRIARRVKTSATFTSSTRSCPPSW